MNTLATSRSAGWKANRRDNIGRYKRNPPSCFVFFLLIACAITMVVYFFRAKPASSQIPTPIVAAAEAAELPKEPTVAVGQIMHLTGYTSRPEETDDTPCIAASNVDICKLRANHVNVCASNDYAFGTMLKVTGMGTCVVLDRMNSRYTGNQHLDWYFGKDLDAARQFGIPDLFVTKL